MDKGVNSIITEYAKQVQETYNPKAIYLFGSYAKGEETENSDIDIAVVIDPIDMNRYRDLAGELWSLAARFEGEIEPKLIIDEGRTDKFDFLYEVKKTGRKIEI